MIMLMVDTGVASSSTQVLPYVQMYSKLTLRGIWKPA